MARHSRPGNPEEYRQSIAQDIENLKDILATDDIRQQVISLSSIMTTLQDLGASLLEDNHKSAKNRILEYMKRNVGMPIDGKELQIIAGISEYARRVSELRVEEGWRIFTGITLQNINEDFDEVIGQSVSLKPDQYILFSPVQDMTAVDRWKTANMIRNDKSLNTRDKILKFFRKYVGQEITGEELRYVTGDKTEWARRTRERRTEYGWPVATHFTGRPDLAVGIYVLEEDRQAEEHDRKIPEKEQRQAFMRDRHTCQDCGWTHALWNPSDPRHLELHHLKHHADGGANTADNLITLCNICHDARHAKKTTA